MKHIVFSVTKKTAYLLSALVILTALAIIALGIVTPYLDKHLPDIEAQASAALEMPVKIEKIRLSWYKYEPEISLNHVTVLSKDKATPLMQIDKVRVFISIPKSVWQRQPVFAGLMVSGTELEVKENAKGEFVVQGFPAIGGYTGQPFSEESKFSDVVGWLSNQPEIILQNIDIRYTGMLGQQRFVTLYNLGLQNEGQRHTILGRAILHQDIPTKVTLAAQWQGNVMDYPNIQGKVYGYVSGLSLNQWWKGLSWQDWQLKNGYLSAKIWGVWNNGAWKRVQTLFTVYDAQAYSTTSKKPFQINRVSGDLGWKQVGNEQIIAGDDILLDLPQHLWPATSFYVHLVPNEKQALVPDVVKTGYLNITDALQFLNASPTLLSGDLAKWANALAPQGDILHLQASQPNGLTDANQISFDAGFAKLQMQAYQSLPGFKNLTGRVQGSLASGELSLNSADAGLTLPSVFLKPITLGALKGNVTWQQNADKKWQIQIPSLAIHNDDIDLKVKKSSLLFLNAVPTVDIEGEVAVKNAARLAPYFPMKVFDQGLQEWLSAAFLSGRAEDGSFILKGDLKDYPFDKNNGEFYVNAHVKDLTLRYAPDWPVIDDIDAGLTFKGREMSVALKSGRVMSIPVENVSAVIPSLGGDSPAILSVTGIQLNTDFANALAFVHRSPLEKNIGRMFKDAAVSGPINLTLGLTVPLENPDNTQVNGQIALSNAVLNLVPWRLSINDLTGNVNFTEKTTSASQLTGKLFDQPLNLSFNTVAPPKGESYVQATVDTHLNISDVQDWLHLPLAQSASGGTDVNAVLNLAFDAPMQIQLQTNLKGIAIKAPAPYGKTADAVIPTTATLVVAENQPLKAKVSYGDLIQAAMLLKSTNDSFGLAAANVMLGKGDPAWPAGNGLTFTANFDQLDWATIQSYQAQMGGSGGLPDGLTLNAVDVNVKTLSLLGQTITNAAISAKPATPNWMININSDQLVGSVRVPMSLKPSSEIAANLSRVNLSGGGASGTAPSMKANAIPALNITANNVRFNGMMLGDLTLATAPASSGLSIKQLDLRGNGMTMTSNGAWTQSGNANTTHLVGQVNATQLSQWLSGLGVDAHNLVATKGQGGFNLTWNAAPADLSLASMNGNAMISLGAGRIVDVADTNGAKMDIGKMLSIFSLQTIPRRLSLDFSDVFQKGYSFDSFKGDFVFTRGNAVTHNTRFDGPVAKVGIDGAIGLATKTYNFTLSVTPYVTSSIPVAAAIISGPVAGIAALAVNKIISSSVAQATTYYYAVGGTWAKPTWNEVKKQ